MQYRDTKGYITLSLKSTFGYDTFQWKTAFSDPEFLWFPYKEQRFKTKNYILTKPRFQICFCQIFYLCTCTIAVESR